ncbi:MAG: efflux RND transporter permease subunit, partial [Planctomycetota bacterium]
MFSAFFIHRPIFAAVISIVIMIVGSLALLSLPIARYPEIAPPTVEVTCVYPGANAKVVGETVATPLEQEINGVEGMLYMSSTSSNDGNMSLTVTFEVGVDIDMATVLVQNRVSVAESKLPEEVRRQGVQVKKKSAEITVLAAIFSRDGGFSDLYLSNYATLRLKDELTRLNGVGDVTVFGAGDYGMRIWIDPDKLKARGLTTNDVVTAIREQNVQVAAGSIGAPPIETGQAFQYTVNTLGRLSEVSEFEGIVVKSGESGQLTLVKDVARVELGSQTYDIASTFNGSPCAALAIYQLPGSNAIEVAKGVERKLEELSAAFPQGLEYQISYDSTDVINASIEEVIVTLFITLALVVVTVFIFLQSLRATIIPLVTIPVSLIGTFAVMAALGFSVNLLTLFGLVLVIGIVVDDAIVVVENCTRLMDDEGLSPKEAALKSMREVSGPIVATTLVLLAVFVPTVFMGGIVGRLFIQFAVTISIATVFSSINALTLSPALAAIVLRPTKKSSFFVFAWFNALLGATTNVYVGAVKWAIRVAVIGIAAFVGMVVVAGFGFTTLPSGFVPQEDEGWYLVNLQLPDAAALERTTRVTERITEDILDIPEVENCLVINGYSILDGSRSSNSATAFVTLAPWSERGPRSYRDVIMKSAGKLGA